MSISTSFKRTAAGLGGTALAAAAIWLGAVATEEQPSNLMAIPVGVVGVTGLMYAAMGRPGHSGQDDAPQAPGH